MPVTFNVDDKGGKTPRAEGRPVCLITGKWQELHLARQPGAPAMLAQVRVYKETRVWAFMCTHRSVHTPTHRCAHMPS